METLWQDLKCGLRIYRKTVGLTIIAVLTLALGIGSSTAVFGIVDAILLKPLPFPHSERIVFPWRLAPKSLNLGYDKTPWGLEEFWRFSRELKTFESIAAFQGGSFNFTGSGEAVRLDGLRTSAGLFPSLGIAPEIGRVFTAEEDRPGYEHEVILSDQLWRERFSGDRGILGRTIELGGAAYTVVGVMPPGFVFPRVEEMPQGIEFPRFAQLWIPLALPPAKLHREDPDELTFVGRLKPGATVDQAQAELNVFTRNRERENAGAKGWFSIQATPMTRQVAGDTRQPLLLMLGAVGVVLLIACSNVASLLLARSLGRSREFTLRAALGAGGNRLVRQLLTESLLLAAAGGILGIGLAESAIHFAKVFGPADIPRLSEAGLDLQVLAFAMGITLLTGILFGLAPALGAFRGNLAESLRQGSQRTGGSLPGSRLRQILLVSEVALALVLVVSAGLLVRTFRHLLNVDPGFNAARVLTFEVSLPGSKYADSGSIVKLYDRTLEHLQSLPGVESAGLARSVPMGGAPDGTGIRIPGYVRSPDKPPTFAAYSIVSAGYFPAVRTPILRGRDFQASDTATSKPVTIINRSMAEKFWPNQDPIGREVGPGSPKYPLTTIIGIVPDVKEISLRQEPGPEMYVLYSQKPWPSMLTMQVAVRTKADPSSMTASVRDAIRAVDPELPLAKVATLSTLVGDTMAQPRFSMLLLGAFGALALVLASVGMYGVVSYSVTQRTREIGIRMALGAGRSNVFGMILGQGVRLAGLGIFIGVVVAWNVTQVMARFLYGVQPTDPATFAAVCLLLIGIVLAACYVPARRATRVDPLSALREE